MGENVTFADGEALTTEWCDSFPNALPISIRDNFIALLEETTVDPQIRIELEIIFAFVGVAEPGRGTKQESCSPVTAKCDNARGLCSSEGANRVRRRNLKQGIRPEIIGGGGLKNFLGQFIPTGGEAEVFGAVSGTYAATVAFVFLEQVSINGGSIMII